MSEYWCRKFLEMFFASLKEFDIKKAETCLFNSNAEAQRLLNSKKLLQESPINIGWLFKKETIVIIRIPSIHMYSKAKEKEEFKTSVINVKPYCGNSFVNGITLKVKNINLDFWKKLIYKRYGYFDLQIDDFNWLACYVNRIYGYSKNLFSEIDIFYLRSYIENENCAFIDDGSGKCMICGHTKVNCICVFL